LANVPNSEKKKELNRLSERTRRIRKLMFIAVGPLKRCVRPAPSKIVHHLRAKGTDLVSGKRPEKKRNLLEESVEGNPRSDG